MALLRELSQDGKSKTPNNAPANKTTVPVSSALLGTMPCFLASSLLLGVGASVLSDQNTRHHLPKVGCEL